jgi:dolichyl-phosphate-mannose-protein mannosyltransferase
LVSSEPGTAVIDLDDSSGAGSTPAGDAGGKPDDGAAGATGDPHDAAADRVSEETRRRLAVVSRDPMSWVATGFIVLIGAALRLVNLGYPPGKIFDEIYYATEADELLAHGVEWRPETNTGDYVVHPPLGKWCIALGEWLFGYTAFGWRFMPMIAGVLSILLIVRIGRRLFRSTALGCAAGLLVCLDGLHFVLSRSALLDIFITLFVLTAFGCLLLDRDQRRSRWLAALRAGREPRLGVPYWRLLAALFMGCACGVKLSGAFFIPALIGIMLMWEIQLRRSAGARSRWTFGTLNVAGWTAGMAVVVLSVYIATWAGWFATDQGWNRHGLALRGEAERPVLGALINLWDYHKQAYQFHTGLNSPHDYQSWPWQWLLMGRPVAFFWETNHPCGSARCASEVLLLGTPLLWWSFIPALAGLVWFGIARRDRMAAAIGIMIAAGLLPWFWYHYDGGRTMFVFYALPAMPFLVLAVVYVFGAIIGPPGRASPTSLTTSLLGQVPDRRLVGAVAFGVYVLLIAACFAYFHPIYVGDSIPYTDWWDRMWLGRRWV